MKKVLKLIELFSVIVTIFILYINFLIQIVDMNLMNTYLALWIALCLLYGSYSPPYIEKKMSCKNSTIPLT